ncbi:hypothetical protein ADL22_12625 [Streptomyces sp. NRRL F-4489]|uniref:hypothetical protein n=1 Tax=Streptomyces sp. NRRL F-4489 TaxID=1609095 RepID=UPI000749FDFF|nr:hypothetical protein [Streptomyces sp. NRRL F-4489]KUL44781.1 hypothetical protein ADL22_12625 [Streptomyces sp. NRRL F-4489]
MAHHYHVGFNLVGRAPQADDVQCVEDAEDAVLALEALLTEQIDEWAERCDHFGNDPEWVGCSCAWCNLVLDVERVRDHIGDESLGFKLREHGQAGEVFYAPGSGGKAFWIKRVDGKSCAT